MKLEYTNTTKERLDKFLASQMPSLSRSQLKKVIQAGQVLVNGEKPSVHEWLHQGDTVEVDLEVKEVKGDKKIIKPEIIEETDDFLILNKPSGLLVHPTDKQEANTLVAWLLDNYPQLENFGDQNRPGLVHRLDKDVSGIIVIALNIEAYEHLKKQFQNRTIEKHYTALVNGKVLKEEGTINTNLERDKKTGKMKALSDNKTKDEGKEAITKYAIIQSFIKHTLLDVQIITGRTHQIRAHLSSIGHSIVGDKLYATKDIRKTKKEVLPRPFLHATSIAFKNLDGQKVIFKSKLPEDLDNFLQNLK